MPKPLRLTDDLIETLARIVRTGAHVDRVCAANGIHRSTYYDWRKRGLAEKDRLTKPGARHRQAEDLFVRFVDAMDRAEAEAELAVIAHWNRHFATSAQACERFLARRHRDRWGDSIELTGAGGGPLEVVHVDATEQLAAKLARARERLLRAAGPQHVTDDGQATAGVA